MLPPHSWHGTGPEPLVLIAGLGAPGASWKPFLATASEHYRVLTLDNCGAGRAPAAPRGLRIGDMARDLLSLLDALGLAALVPQEIEGESVWFELKNDTTLKRNGELAEPSLTIEAVTLMPRS